MQQPHSAIPLTPEQWMTAVREGVERAILTLFGLERWNMHDQADMRNSLFDAIRQGIADGIARREDTP